MDDDFKQELREQLKAIEQRLNALEGSHNQLKEAYSRSRAHLRRLWLRPPMWTFEQHTPYPLDFQAFTDFGIENLIELVRTYKKSPELLKRWPPE
jgi:hypothetical protein